MNSILKSLASLVLLSILLGQINQEPQRVYRYAFDVNSKEWYQNQELLWKNNISRNSSNEMGWSL